MCVSDHKLVFKRWEEVARKETRAAAQERGTYAGQPLTKEGWGQHLLHQSKLVRPWTEMEERRWMQMVGRVYPVMTYLRQIDKHPTGECPWCKGGVRETLCHFQSECKQFRANRTLAHHDIARATVAALKDIRLPGWKFYYETTMKDLPFEFAWSSLDEEVEQQDRRPDGVAYNEMEGTVIFLEFTRAMDNPDNMLRALADKGEQYVEAVAALERAQRRRATRHLPRIQSVSTAPLIFGVRGTVLMTTAREALHQLKLTEPQLKRVLAAGVRAAITAASNMCSARAAALKCLPRAPRGPDGKRAKVIIPPKPFQPPTWRRGG